MFYVYVLKSKRKGRFYTGHTNNLERRILEHNIKKDKTKFTSVNGPWELMFFEVFNTRSESVNRERFLKTGKGRDFIKEKFWAHSSAG